MNKFYNANMRGTEYDAVLELVKRHNDGILDLPDDKLKVVAQKAFEYGIPFDVESKPISKGLFDLADTAMFGLIPNEWRPESIGQEQFGETRMDRYAGNIGSLGGFLTGVGGAGYGLMKYGPKGAQAVGGAMGKAKPLADDAISYSGDAMSRGAEASKEAIAKMRSAIHNNKYYQKAQDPLGYGQYDMNMQRLDNLLAYAS